MADLVPCEKCARYQGPWQRAVEDAAASYHDSACVFQRQLADTQARLEELERLGWDVVRTGGMAEIDDLRAALVADHVEEMEAELPGATVLRADQGSAE